MYRKYTFIVILNRTSVFVYMANTVMQIFEYLRRTSSANIRLNVEKYDSHTQHKGKG